MSRFFVLKAALVLFSFASIIQSGTAFATQGLEENSINLSQIFVDLRPYNDGDPTKVYTAPNQSVVIGYDRASFTHVPSGAGIGAANYYSRALRVMKFELKGWPNSRFFNTGDEITARFEIARQHESAVGCTIKILPINLERPVSLEEMGCVLQPVP